MKMRAEMDFGERVFQAQGKTNTKDVRQECTLARSGSSREAGWLEQWAGGSSKGTGQDVVRPDHTELAGRGEDSGFGSEVGSHRERRANFHWKDQTVCCFRQNYMGRRVELAYW